MYKIRCRGPTAGARTQKHTHTHTGVCVWRGVVRVSCREAAVKGGRVEIRIVVVVVIVSMTTTTTTTTTMRTPSHHCVL